MTVQLIPLDDKRAYVSGLAWKTLDWAGSRSSQINAERDHGGRYKVEFKGKVDGDEWLGICGDLDLEEGDAKKSLISIAAQVANHPRLVGRSVLVMLETEPDADGQTSVICAGLKNGTVWVDEIISPREASDMRSRFRQECMQKDSSLGQGAQDMDAVVMGSVTTIDEPDEPFGWEELLVARRSRFTKGAYTLGKLGHQAPPWLIPVSGGVLALALCAWGGNFLWQKYRAEAMQKLAAAQRKEPTIQEQYAQSRARFMQTKAMPATAATALMRYVGKRPLSSLGWDLQSADCAAQGCTLVWARVPGQGTYESFKEMVSADFPQYVLGPGDTASATRTLDVPSLAPPTPDKWLTIPQWEVTERSKWQRMKDAGIPFVFGEPQIDALPDGAQPDKFAAVPNVIQTIKWSMTDANPNLLNLVEFLPAASTLDSFAFKLTRSDTGGMSAKVSVKGKVLVAKDAQK